MGSILGIRACPGAARRSGRIGLLLPAMLIAAALIAGGLALLTTWRSGPITEVVPKDSRAAKPERPAIAYPWEVESPRSARSLADPVEPPAAPPTVSGPRRAQLVCLDEDDCPLVSYRFELRDAVTGRGLGGGTYKRRKRGDWPHFALPGEPFELWVTTLGYRDVEGLLLVPEEVEEQLVLCMPHLPDIQGSVTRGGEPVAGATVAVYADADHVAQSTGFAILEELSSAPWLTLETDESGRFEAWAGIGEHYWVVAHGGELAGGLALCEHDPRRAPGCVECELRLPQTGTVELHITEAEPGGCQVIWAVLARSKFGVEFEPTEQLGVRRATGVAEGEWYLSAGFKKPEGFPWGIYSWRGGVVQVQAGQTTSVSLDPAYPPPANLAGHLRLVSAPPPPDVVLWQLTLYSDGPESTELRKDILKGGSELEFDLELPGDGTYRLELVGHLADLSYLQLEDLVTVEGGHGSWLLDLPVGCLRGTDGELSRGWQRPLRLSWDGPGDLRARVSFAEGFTRERFELGAVPAGNLSLERFDPERNELVVEGQVYLAAGAEELLRLP